MIRTNLAVLMILTALGMVIAGLVQASTTVSPTEAAPSVNAAVAKTALWHGVNPRQAKPISGLKPRNIAPKPAMIDWPTGNEPVDLLVKFNDNLRIRLDGAGRPISSSGENIDSLIQILDDLEVSLERVYKVEPAKLQGIINRAEMFSGKAQPDLEGTYIVRGDPVSVEAASMILLHDPRVEWAQLKSVPVDPRTQVIQRQAEAAKAAPAKVEPPVATSYEQFDAKGLPELDQDFDNDASFTARWDTNFENEYVASVRATNGACCFSPPLTPSYECQQLSQDDCANFGGTWQGNATSCADTDCTRGACCLLEDEAAIGLMNPLQDFGPTNPVVVRMCTDRNPNDATANINATVCLDLDGIFVWLNQCSDVTAPDPASPFLNCSANPDVLFAGWEPTGACCAAGDCDVVVLSECLTSGGIWLPTFMQRYQSSSVNATSPALNPNINPQLLATTYGMTNFVLASNPQTPDDLVDIANSNTTFSYYSGIPLRTPFGVIYPDAMNNRILFEPGNDNFNDNVTNFTPGSYRRGLIDMRVTNQNGKRVLEPAYGNAPPPLSGPPSWNPFLISGGFTLGSQTNGSGLLFDPNMNLACFTSGGISPCEFGICAISCWEPPCGPLTITSSVTTDANSPIPATSLQIPTSNPLCGNYVTESGCNQMYLRSTLSDFNPSGSLFQDLVLNFPNQPLMAGCQTENDVPAQDPIWFIDYFDPAGGICCPPAFGCEVETYEPIEGADILRGDCFFSHTQYPTMLINQVGGLQLQGEECYGGEGSCDPYCETETISDTVCATAPICCDFDICEDGSYSDYFGWSFICSDLAAQNEDVVADAYYTDFDQALKLGGPFPEYNPLRLVSPTPRTLTGEIDFTDFNGDGLVPDILPPPAKCMINYGVQNQCTTPYFSPYQPSMALGSYSPTDNSGGCADFQCCHIICSIVEPDPVTGFNYRTCCTDSWTQECVDKAQEICYLRQNGVLYNQTPNFVPLQFHLSERVGRGPSPIPVPLRRLAAAPMLPPSVVSPVPGQPDTTPDNWLQSVHQVQWQLNPTPAAVASVTSWASPSVLDVTLRFESKTGEVLPAVGGPGGPGQFFTGNPPSSPPLWWTGNGLTLYGNEPGTGWPVDPSYLSPSFGLYSWGEFLSTLTPGHHPWGPYVNGTAGAGIRVAVLDYAAWIQEYIDDSGILQGAIHEDLGNVYLEGPALGYPPVRMLFDAFVTQPQRGTAVLGTIGAGANSYGVNGISPQAAMMFFPVASADTGLRETDAWVHAIESLGFGDIMVATYPGNNGSECLLLDPEIAQLIAVAEGNGISVVIPAGDRGQSLEGALDEVGSTIVAGGSLPTDQARRYWSSNYVDTEGAITSAGMAPITTTGGDCNLTRMAINTVPDTATDPPGYISRDMQRRSYTNSFGVQFDGSKAAAAQVAGVAACLQGFSLQYYGIPQPPDQVKALFAATNRGDVLTPAFGNNYGDPAFGFDLDNSAELSPSVGGPMNPAAAGVAMVIDPDFALDASEYLYNFAFIRGLQQFGMLTSLEEPDGNYLIALSEQTERGSYTPNFVIPAGEVTYIITGQYTDLYIQGFEPADREILGAMQVLAVIDAPPGSNNVARMYSYTSERWVIVGAPITAPGDDPLWTFESLYPAQFFGDDGFFHLRMVTNTGLSGGNGGPGTIQSFLIRYDYVDFVPTGITGGGGGDDDG